MPPIGPSPVTEKKAILAYYRYGIKLKDIAEIINCHLPIFGRVIDFY